MTITIFVNPDSLNNFLRITQILEDLSFENEYEFDPTELNFTEAMISNYIWINMEIKEYLKLKCCIGKLSNKPYNTFYSAD